MWQPSTRVRRETGPSRRKCESSYIADRSSLSLALLPLRRPTATAAAAAARNSGNSAYALLDLEKWPASSLLGFDPTPSNFDINNVVMPSSAGKRPAMGTNAANVMPLCFRDVGPAVLSPKP